MKKVAVQVIEDKCRFSFSKSRSHGKIGFLEQVLKHFLWDLKTWKIFIPSKSTIETLEKGVEYVQS